MFLPLIIVLSLAVAGFLLALVSDVFGYVLSRAVEPALDHIEYRLALLDRRRKETEPREHGFATRSAYSHAG